MSNQTTFYSHQSNEIWVLVIKTIIQSPSVRLRCGSFRNYVDCLCKRRLDYFFIPTSTCLLQVEMQGFRSPRRSTELDITISQRRQLIMLSAKRLTRGNSATMDINNSLSRSSKGVPPFGGLWGFPTNLRLYETI
jgi:hypothetical protein